MPGEKPLDPELVHSLLTLTIDRFPYISQKAFG